MLDAVGSFVDLALWGEKSLRSALAGDLSNEDLQREMHPTPDAYLENKARWSPRGETGRVIDKLSNLEPAYRAANAEAISAGLGAHLLPKLEAAYEASRAIISEALRAQAESRGCLPDSHQIRFNDTIKALVSVVGSPTADASAQPVATNTSAADTGRDLTTKDCTGDGTRDDTSRDTGKKVPKKKRYISTTVLSRLQRCGKMFKDELKKHPKTTKTEVIRDLAKQQHWNAETLIRASASCPDLFYDATPHATHSDTR